MFQKMQLLFWASPVQTGKQYNADTVTQKMQTDKQTDGFLALYTVVEGSLLGEMR